MVGERAKHESCRVGMRNGFQKYRYMFHQAFLSYLGVLSHRTYLELMAPSPHSQLRLESLYQGSLSCQTVLPSLQSSFLVALLLYASVSLRASTQTFG
jgi:hypothetical protein